VFLVLFCQFASL